MATYIDKIASLSPSIAHVICEQGTEAPFSSAYDVLKQAGSYLCRRCGLALLRTASQFNAGCGWPSFDAVIAGAVSECPDADGQRTEIKCARCTAHLGHVFRGEQFTAKNQRHCVNGLALDFVASQTVLDTEEAIVAGGCFWGVDYYLRQSSGVLSVEVGYTGGHTFAPTYGSICQGDTGHYEAVRVIFDTTQTNYTAVLRDFFAIHDPTQADGQGVDRGLQYRSAVFYYTEEQHRQLRELIGLLEKNGYKVATQCLPVAVFWPAERDHQAYYLKHPALGYCHQKVDRFNTPKP